MEIVEEISITWSIEDVQSVAPDLCDEQASKVLMVAKRKHDANIGINWDVLSDIADRVRDNKI